MKPMRPRIPLTISPTDRVLEIIGWLALAFIWMYVFWKFPSLPETIPMHFDGSGKVNGWGSRWSVFFLPAITTIVYVGLTYLNKFPHVFNYLEEITEENAERQYTLSTSLIRLLKTIIALLFSFLTYEIVYIALNSSMGMEFWVLPLVLCSIFLPIIVYLIRVGIHK